MKPKRPPIPIMPYSRYDSILKFKNDIERNHWLSFIHQGDIEVLDSSVIEKPTINKNRKFLLIA